MNKTSVRNEIGGRFKKMRLSLGFSQEEMGAHMGVTRPSYSHYEGGETFPHPGALKILAHRFNISLDWLIAGLGDMFISKEKEQQEKIPDTAIPGEVQEMINHMTRVPLLHHEILRCFHKFKLEYKNLLETTPNENNPHGTGSP